MPVTLIDELRGRARNGARAASMVTAHALRALNVADATNAEKAKHAANQHLSDTGRVAKTREAAVQLAVRFALSKAGFAHERATRKSERDALVKTALSPFVSDALASEIRSALKTLPHGEVCVLAAKDPRVLAAIAAAPQIVTGIAPEVLTQLTDSYLVTNHAADFERAQEKDAIVDEAFVVAESAIRVAEFALYQAGGFPHTKAFEDWLHEVAKPNPKHLEAEAAGAAAPGMPAWTVSESLDIDMSSSLAGLPK
jgi:hypothetical protein